MGVLNRVLEMAVFHRSLVLLAVVEPPVCLDHCRHGAVQAWWHGVSHLRVDSMAHYDVLDFCKIIVSEQILTLGWCLDSKRRPQPVYPP